MTNVRISLTELKNGITMSQEHNDLTEKQVRELRSVTRMDKFRGASTGNLGYAAEGTPKYFTQTGIIENTSIVVSWTQWSK